MNAGDYKQKGYIPSGELHIAITVGKKTDTHKTLLINPRFFVALFCQGLIYDIKHSNEIKTVREGEGWRGERNW